MDWQDLNDSPIKKYWKHGRAWIGRFHFEWSIPTHFLHFSVGINGGDSNRNLTFAVACKVFSIYASMRFVHFRVGHWSTYSDKPFFIHEEREFKISIHDGSLWLRLWGDPMGGWSRDMSWWLVNHCFNPMDFFFGMDKYTTKSLKTGECLIPMPEGSYPATYDLFVSTWKRPRWPFKRQLQRITIDIKKGIPFEGKGENSWDCGEDATFGITCMARTLEEGIGELVATVLQSRQRYGGKHLHRDQTAIVVNP